MKTLHLPEGPLKIDELVNATSALAPDLRGDVRFRGADGRWSEPVPASNRDQTRQVHMVTISEMARRGEVLPRSVLTFAPWAQFEPSDAPQCYVAWDDAKAFCKRLDIDLQVSVSPALAAVETPQERDAAVLARFLELGGLVIKGEIAGRRGALADLVKADGRKRQTLTPIIRRAAAREAEARDALSGMVNQLR